MKHFYIILILICPNLFGQNPIYNRLNAIKKDKVIFYNIDGYNFSSEIISLPYSEENVQKSKLRFRIPESSLTFSDKALDKNKIFQTSENRENGIVQYNSYYFLEYSTSSILAIDFHKLNKIDRPLELELVSLIKNNKILESCFSSPKIDSINFGGRKIKLHESCYWTNVNAIQCPYSGEINWSIHKDYASAISDIESQEIITESKTNFGKIISDEIIDVNFEGTITKAKKKVFKTKTGIGVLAGAKTLTVYYAVGNIRGNYISCVMSHWNNDNILPSGLPSLIDKIMTIK